MSTYRPLTDEQKRRARSMHDCGWTAATIAHEIGCHDSRQVMRLLRRKRSRTIDRQEIVRRFQAGESDRQIADALRCAKSSIENIRMHLGLRRGRDLVGPEKRAAQGLRMRHQTEEQKAAQERVAAAPKWGELLNGRDFHDDDPGDRGVIPPRRDAADGLYASSMSGWA